MASDLSRNGYIVLGPDSTIIVGHTALASFFKAQREAKHSMKNESKSWRKTRKGSKILTVNTGWRTTQQPPVLLDLPEARPQQQLPPPPQQKQLCSSMREEEEAWNPH
ncbi:hypothetical protein PG994_013055 [Apiospora phragmitis]|uniref:Uncharacterized protein n=1 Tax=Apiospora phragmitis TaxID=2905665 RepID=A0ABR1T7J9_9PEZI